MSGNTLTDISVAKEAVDRIRKRLVVAKRDTEDTVAGREAWMRKKELEWLECYVKVKCKEILAAMELKMAIEELEERAEITSSIDEGALDLCKNVPDFDFTSRMVDELNSIWLHGGVFSAPHVRARQIELTYHAFHPAD